MNIFFLHSCPHEAAKAQCDTHVRKMIVEAAQLLCAAHTRLGYTSDRLYRPYNVNSRFVTWLLESSANYQWLHTHFLQLCEEYNKIGGKVHACIRERGFDEFLQKTPEGIENSSDRTVPAWAFDKWPDAPSSQALDSEEKIVYAYRQYYQYKFYQWRGLGQSMKWTNRSSPQWLDIH